MSEENPNIQRVDHPRGGHGFLNTENKLVLAEGAMKVVPPGICPRCEAAAPVWYPPLDDSRYRQRIQALQEIHKIGEIAAHRRWLENEGGFIATCGVCQTSFWVSAAAAKIKE